MKKTNADLIQINGKTYKNVSVVSISESYEILYSEDTGRTVASGGRMFLSPIGTWFNHTVTFKCKSGYEAEFDELYTYLYQPRDYGIPIKIAHNQTMIEYEAYVSKGNRDLKKVRDEYYRWGDFQVNFIAMEAYIKW